MSARRNKSESAKATAINRSSWGLFSRLIVVDALDRKMVNRRLGESEDASRVPLSSIETARSSLFFTEEKRVPTRAPASTRSDHCTGGMESSEEVIKRLLFLLLNGLADPLGVELLEL